MPQDCTSRNNYFDPNCDKLLMKEKQEVTTAGAARIKRMPLGTFLHYVREGRGPAFEEHAGVRIYKVDEVERWEPLKLKRGPKHVK